MKQGGRMVAEDTVFSVLYEKFVFWSILVGVFTFGWMFLAILRYREGVEPDTTHLDHIEVGAFPVERHNTRMEVMFYVLPTLIVLWLIVLALSSNTAVWEFSDDEETQNITVIGKQWFWEFEYTDSLTWEDDPSETHVNVQWSGTSLVVTADGSSATNVTVTTDGVTTEYLVDEVSKDVRQTLTFQPAVFSTIEVTDANGEHLHTWMHIPEGYVFSSAAGEDLIIPCDTQVLFTMISKPSDDSNPNYVGVQHSFWLPEWGIKEDLVPGLEGGTKMMVIPDDAGTFPIRCAEYCGAQHSVMIGQVKVVAQDGRSCSADTGVAKTETTTTGGEH